MRLPSDIRSPATRIGCSPRPSRSLRTDRSGKERPAMPLLTAAVLGLNIVHRSSANPTPADTLIMGLRSEVESWAVAIPGQLGTVPDCPVKWAEGGRRWQEWAYLPELIPPSGANSQSFPGLGWVDRWGPDFDHATTHRGGGGADRTTDSQDPCSRVDSSERAGRRPGVL